MSINTGKGWNFGKDFPKIATNTLKLKLDSLTIDEGDMLVIQENGANAVLQKLELTGCTFDFAGGTPEIDDLPAIACATTLTDIDLTGSSGLSGDPSIGWQVCVELVNFSINDCGYNAAAVDSFLIAVNAAVQGTDGLGSNGTPAVINVAGASNGIRTAASDAANTALGVAGFTVTQNA